MPKTKTGLQEDITNALEGWLTGGTNVTAFDRLNSVKSGILDGRYGEGVTLETLKDALTARHAEFEKDGVGDEDFSSRWQWRTKIMADSVDDTINYLKERK